MVPCLQCVIKIIHFKSSEVAHVLWKSQTRTWWCQMSVWGRIKIHYCHAHNNWGPRNSFQRFSVPVYYWKTVENLKLTLNHYENGSIWVPFLDWKVMKQSMTESGVSIYVKTQCTHLCRYHNSKQSCFCSGMVAMQSMMHRIKIYVAKCPTN